MAVSVFDIREDSRTLPPCFSIMFSLPQMYQATLLLIFSLKRAL